MRLSLPLTIARLRLLLAALLIALPLVACSGKECDKCTSDDDCASEGLRCVKFQDGSMRCGSGVGATTCRGL